MSEAIIKKYKYKNKVIGKIILFFSDSEGLKYMVETRKPYIPNTCRTYVSSFTSKEEAIRFADKFFMDILNNEYFMQAMSLKKKEVDNN